MSTQEPIVGEQLTQDQLNWLNERLLQVNDTILQGSRQAGFLAAAIIAASPLWMPSMGSSTWTRLALVAATLSIACSAVAHVLTGWQISAALTRAARYGPTSHAGIPYLIPAWIAGAAQVALLLLALTVFVGNLW